MQLAGFPRLSVDPAVCGGRPVIKGTRMRVKDVLDLLANGASEAEIVADYPYVTAPDIRACLAYAVGGYDLQLVSTHDVPGVPLPDGAKPDDADGKAKGAATGEAASSRPMAGLEPGETSSDLE